MLSGIENLIDKLFSFFNDIVVSPTKKDTRTFQMMLNVYF